jgi:aryl-alcohol dehydrogenase-like predicted oxidoreductase
VTARRLGKTFIDTAPSYAQGRSEEILGQVIEGRRGNDHAGNPLPW